MHRRTWYCLMMGAVLVQASHLRDRERRVGAKVTHRLLRRDQELAKNTPTLIQAANSTNELPFIDHVKDPLSTHTLTGKQPIHVNPKTLRMVDEFGREVYFHGLNVVVKGAPYIPQTEGFDVNNSFSEIDMLKFQELGLNAIRLGTMWPGAEPTRGQYNMTYINAIMKLAEKSAEYGIYSLLDMHQDVLSPKFCGEGVPMWAAIPDNDTLFPVPISEPFKLDADGIPEGGYDGAQCLSHFWGEYYASSAAGSAFQNLYTNFDGLRDSWAQFWKTIATAAQGTGNAVLGFELINEPWAGDIEKHPEQILPGVADRELLQPFYDVAASKIREVDNSHIIFFEGVTFDWLYSGFSHVPGGSGYSNLSVLSYHFYVPPDFSIPVQFEARQLDMERLRCGGMLTEFFVKPCADCVHAEPQDVMAACDDFSQSWLGWEYKPSSIWFQNGSLNEAEVSLIARTYARAVAGHQKQGTTSFDRATNVYKTQYDTVPGLTSQVTMIYLYEKMHYPKGFSVDASSTNTTVTLDVQHVSKNHIAIVHKYAVEFTKTTITVKITPNNTAAAGASTIRFFPPK